MIQIRLLQAHASQASLTTGTFHTNLSVDRKKSMKGAGNRIDGCMLIEEDLNRSRHPVQETLLITPETMTEWCSATAKSLRPRRPTCSCSFTIDARNSCNYETVYPIITIVLYQYRTYNYRIKCTRNSAKRCCSINNSNVRRGKVGRRGSLVAASIKPKFH